MKKVFLIFLLLLIVALQAESQTHPVTINLNGSVAGSSNISSNGGHTTYTRYHECWITDLDPDGDGHFHVYDWEPTIYPTKITVSIATPAKGYGYVQGQLDSAIVNGTQLITGSGGKITTGSAGTWWIDYDAMKPRAQEAFYTHKVYKEADAPSGLDTTYRWSSSGRGDTYSVYWRGSASVGVTLTNGVTTSHNGIGFLTTGALLKSGQVTWSQSSLVQNGEGGTGGGSWKVVHKERCRVCKDEVGMHEHQRLCYGCLEWYECYKHPGDHIEVSCPQLNGLYCSYGSYYKCSPHTHNYSSGSSADNTPNCPDCTSHCSSPCGCMNSGTCNGTVVDNTPDCSYCTSGCSSCDSDDDDDDDDSSSDDDDSDDDSSSVTCSRPGCDASEDHRVPPCSACGAGYWTCGDYASWSKNQHRVRTCRRAGCSNTWQRCISSTPACKVASGQGCWAADP